MYKQQALASSRPIGTKLLSRPSLQWPWPKTLTQKAMCIRLFPICGNGFYSCGHRGFASNYFGSIWNINWSNTFTDLSDVRHAVRERVERTRIPFNLLMTVSGVYYWASQWNFKFSAMELSSTTRQKTQFDRYDSQWVQALLYFSKSDSTENLCKPSPQSMQVLQIVHALSKEFIRDLALASSAVDDVKKGVYGDSWLRQLVCSHDT